MQETLIECVFSAGKLLLKYFRRPTNSRLKGNPSSVVTDADLAAEEIIVKSIRSKFPQHRIIGEECGLIQSNSEYTWIIDPLDGTSNFVAGIPWFGVQIALLRNATLIMSAIYLPTEDLLYFSEIDGGVLRNGQRIKLAPEAVLANALCAFGLDAAADPLCGHRNSELFFRLSNGVRNLRATNSVIDFCFTLDAQFGGFINLNTKVWDIAPISLMLREAGGKLTDLQGDSIIFQLDDTVLNRNYAVLGAGNALHPQLLDLISDSKQNKSPNSPSETSEKLF